MCKLLSFPVIFGAVGLFVLSSCSPKDGPPANVAQFTASADSAAASVWEWPQKDTIKHSSLYDSVRKYVLPALDIEKERRLWADSLTKVVVLRPETLKDRAARQTILQHLAIDSTKTIHWKLRIDSLFLRYTSFVTRTADSLFDKTDSSRRQTFISGLLRYSYFQPTWRSEFDSLEQEAMERQRSIINLIDTSKSDVRFDSLIRFEAVEQEQYYNQLLSELDTIARREQEFLQHIKE